MIIELSEEQGLILAKRRAYKTALHGKLLEHLKLYSQKFDKAFIWLSFWPMSNTSLSLHPN
jgi:hypothetical protein